MFSRHFHTVENFTMQFHKTLAAVLLSLGAAAGDLRAGYTINWGSEIHPTNTHNVESDGVTLWNAGYTVSLGVFAGIFVPDENNTGLWATEWRELSRTTYNVEDGYYAGEAILQDNTVFAAGQQAYVWIYNDPNPVPGSEWLMVTDTDWTIPTVPEDQQQTLFPKAWDVVCSTGDGADAIFGGLTLPVAPGVEQVGGVFTAPAAAYCLQTHTFAAVPEPGSLLPLAGLALLLRRKARSA